MCFADGKVFPPVAFPANVTIPDQRALIHFTNGTERLVIETRFSGAGTNFAWVVPLPAQPLIEEATTGLFPTLQYLFRPQIKHNVPRYYFWFLLAAGFIALVRWGTRSVWNGFLVALLMAFIAVILLPGLAMSKAKSAGSGSSATDAAVSILDRRLVGVFETTTIASRDPTALQAWLRDNDFAVSTNSEPVIASCVKDGWVFVATKIRRDKAESETSTPHPLSFTFKTDKPVYPMRLTGVDNGPLSVELYVFGPWRARAPHFKAVRCARPTYPKPPEPDPMFWLRWSPETPSIVHPLLRKWVGDARVATKLSATLTPAQMRSDVWLDWTAFSEKRHHLYSRSGALTLAANWAAGLFTAGLTGVLCIGWAKQRNAIRPAWYSSRIHALIWLAAGIAAAIYIALPKTPVRLVKDRALSYRPVDILYRISWELLDYQAESPTPNSDGTRARVHSFITVGDTNAPNWKEWARSSNWSNWQNYLLGGPLREEDSPGNYTIRETNGRLQFIGYDAQGAEHVFHERPIRPTE
ncbi:MAG TPA: DUF2330 domain-containing protein [Verrucomicrobiae bacterium]